jgi:UDP-GlcNAc:undecaprenyl-phosphate GlcNAc-1-phosphate transferase
MFNIFESVLGPNRPISWAFHFWPVLVLSLLSALAATWMCKKIAVKFNIVDRPNDTVKTHKEPVAYLGGIGILVGIVVGVFTGIYFCRNECYFNELFSKLLGILAGATIACFVGVVDDLLDLKPRQKILGQVVAGALLVVFGVVPSLGFLSLVGIELPNWVTISCESAIVFIFVLGATNSLNLLDGLDGLCAGVTVIMTIALLLLAVHLGTWASRGLDNPLDAVRIIICLALVGGVFGFLPFNRHPAKIFMGDAGSMLLGFMIASLMLLFGHNAPRWWGASIVVFGLPIMDTAVAFARRILNKRPVFVSDRGHIYDQMIDRGIVLKKTVAICYALTAMYAGIGLIMSQIRTRYAVIVYVLVFALSGLVVWKKGFLKMEGIRGAVKKAS